MWHDPYVTPKKGTKEFNVMCNNPKCITTVFLILEDHFAIEWRLLHPFPYVLLYATSNPVLVYLYCKITRHSFNNTDVVILDSGFETIWERVEQPSLNRKGWVMAQCVSVSNTWNRVLRSFPCRLSRDPSGSPDF